MTACVKNDRQARRSRNRQFKRNRRGARDFRTQLGGDGGGWRVQAVFGLGNAGSQGRAGLRAVAPATAAPKVAPRWAKRRRLLSPIGQSCRCPVAQTQHHGGIATPLRTSGAVFSSAEKVWGSHGAAGKSMKTSLATCFTCRANPVASHGMGIRPWPPAVRAVVACPSSILASAASGFCPVAGFQAAVGLTTAGAPGSPSSALFSNSDHLGAVRDARRMDVVHAGADVVRGRQIQQRRPAAPCPGARFRW